MLGDIFGQAGLDRHKPKVGVLGAVGARVHSKLDAMNGDKRGSRSYHRTSGYLTSCESAFLVMVRADAGGSLRHVDHAVGDEGCLNHKRTCLSWTQAAEQNRNAQYRPW